MGWKAASGPRVSNGSAVTDCNGFHEVEPTLLCAKVHQAGLWKHKGNPTIGVYLSTVVGSRIPLPSREKKSFLG